MRFVQVRRALGITTILALAPVSAYGVNVSSGAGNGSQARTTTYGNGAKVSGELRSTQGYAVYYQGGIIRGRCADPGGKRYASNTSSKSYVTKGGTISDTLGVSCTFDGVRSKVCRDISALPDTCGGWSNRY